MKVRVLVGCSTAGCDATTEAWAPTRVVYLNDLSTKTAVRLGHPELPPGWVDSSSYDIRHFTCPECVLIENRDC